MKTQEYWTPYTIAKHRLNLRNSGNCGQLPQSAGYHQSLILVFLNNNNINLYDNTCLTT